MLVQRARIGIRVLCKGVPPVLRIGQSVHGALDGRPQSLYKHNAIVSQNSVRSAPITLKYVVQLTPKRNFQTSRSLLLNQRPRKSPEELPEKDDLSLDFERTEKAKAAIEVDLSARLKERNAQAEKGEIIRLLRLAAREWRTLSRTPPLNNPHPDILVAIALLLVSSAVSMTIPFSIGKIIDIATSKIESTALFGLTLPQFYTALGIVLCVGGACNFGRIVLLRIAGERTAALLRSRLYQKTIRQDAAFFDSNRHGELISRLSNDTTIAAKSITQNVSDGLRAIVSGIAGFGMMAYVSLPLTGLMSIIVPPLGILGVFYGRYVRKLSKRTQRALGELTKVSEERLGNVKTAQAFNGEVQEVERYNKKIRDLFDLGKKEVSPLAFPAGLISGSRECILFQWRMSPLR
jgi:ATP-binding cassette, subfamily B (MDR/TAP), member 10